MNKKKLLQRSVAFSMLLPFSCGVALPAINMPSGENHIRIAMASTYDQSDIQDINIVLEKTTAFENEIAKVSEISQPQSESLKLQDRSVNMVVSKVNLNVRKSPSTSSGVLGTLKVGESVLHVSISGGWHKVIYNGVEGYVSSSSAYSYISTVETSEKNVESLVNLNVRSSPSSQGTKVGMLSKGEIAKYIKTVGSWYEIVFEGKTAYVSSSSAYTKIVSVDAGGSDNGGSGGVNPDIEQPSESVVFVNTSGLNVRSLPSTNSTVFGVASYGEMFELYKTENGWHKINYKGKTAYVSASYCIVKNAETTTPPQNEKVDTLVMACVNSLNVRSLPSASSACVGSLDKGDMVTFIEKQNGWYETVYKGKTAYVSASDIFSSLAYFDKGSEEIEEVIDLGYTLLGTPYVYGATRYLNYDGSLNRYFTGRSFDCSSMVQYIYHKALGIELGATSRLQSLDGVEVAVGEIQRGDLLFFTNSDRYYNTGIERIGHVAIYLGNNYILHTASDHAVVEEISATRWKYFITARRVTD